MEDAPWSLSAYLLQKRNEGRVYRIPKFEVLGHSLAHPLDVLPFGTLARGRKWRYMRKVLKHPAMSLDSFFRTVYICKYLKVMFSAGNEFTGIFYIFLDGVIHMNLVFESLSDLFHD